MFYIVLVICLFIYVRPKKCHYPSEQGLTLDEAAAVYLYTMEWGDSSLHRVMNAALRSYEGLKKRPNYNLVRF